MQRVQLYSFIVKEHEHQSCGCMGQYLHLVMTYKDVIQIKKLDSFGKVKKKIVDYKIHPLKSWDVIPYPEVQ